MRLRIALAVALTAVLAFGATASAQVYTGRIDLTVVDSTGAVLPGVSVDLSGPQSSTAVSDARGEAHFLNLAPGTYTVAASLAGFADYQNPAVIVGAGVSVPLRVTLAVAGVATQLEVTAESPVIDPKRQTTQTNVTLQELQEVPSSRDPWVVLQTVPGIIVDRVNVGGAESGQQSAYMAKGAGGGENTWNMDGIPITDMAALGASPTYYDFDMFQEMQVTTGGSDIQNPTPGVHLNFVLKGGTNMPHGSARIYFENEDLQADNVPSDLQSRLRGPSGKGNRMDQYSDYGFELGGPILKDRLWAWGAYGKTDVRLRTLSDTLDRTILENYSFKSTGQISDAVRGSFTYFRGDKLKFGRGASPLRPPETTWNQDGPTSLYKGEGNFVIGNNLFVSAKGGYVDGGFQLFPVGGLQAQWYLDDDGVHHGSTEWYRTERPQYNFQGDGNLFRGRHELKFGFAWRRADVDSTDIVPGNGIVTYHIGYPFMYAEVTRGEWGGTSVTGRYINAYAGDTIAWDRLTLTAGLRWDRQSSSVNELTVPASPVIPDILPSVTGQPVDDAIVWNSVAPRVGFSYALDENRKTIARGSYAMFASQLNATAGQLLSTIQYSGVYFYAMDLDGDRAADANELLRPHPDEFLPGTGIIDFYGFDPTNPTRLESINRVGDYKTPITHEVLLGVDREVMPNFGVSGTFTWRRFTRFTWEPLQGVRGDDYVQVGTFTGTQDPIGSWSVPVYGILPDRIPAVRGREYVEREDYSQRYWGFELSATKRMSNRWMARLGFSTNDHREYFDSNQAFTNPTPGPATPLKDGGLVVRQTGGSGKSGIFMVLPKYQFIATAAYQAPYGINLGANLVNRQGYSQPFNRTQVAVNDPLGPRKTVLVLNEIDDFRLDAVTSLDLRVGKEFNVRRARIIVDLDIFNVTNASTVLGRQYDLRSSVFNQVLEIMNPRILRVGLRMNF